MPTYKYVAANASGKRVNSQADFASIQDMTLELKKDGLFLVSYEEVAMGKGSMKKLKTPEVADYCRQLGTLLQSGVSLARAMNILIERDIKPYLKVTYARVSQLVQSGVALSDAMEAQKGIFPDLLIYMIRAGESNGQLDSTCMRMAEHFDKQHRLKGKVKSATTYPIILICLLLVVGVVIFAFVLPKFFTLFAGMGDLPFITKLLLDLSNGFVNNWVSIIIIIFGLIFLFTVLKQSYKFTLALDRMKLSLPIVGKLLKIIYTARFARTFSSLYASGLTILNAIEKSRGTIGNIYIASQFDALLRDVSSGRPLAKSISMINGFDKKLASTIAIGEETGQLEQMLLSTADAFDFEAEEATGRLTAFIEPVMIVVIAVVVCLVMVAVMVPLFGMYDRIGQGYL